MLKTLDHPNVIYLHEIIDDPKKDSIFLVTEFYSKGSLGDMVSSMNNEYFQRCQEQGLPCKKIGLKIKDARSYFRDMLKALYYCHKTVKVIHRDIKPENIMINHNNEAVLIDFGVSALHQGDDSLENNMGSY